MTFLQSQVRITFQPIIIILLTSVLYLPSLSGDFILDDKPLIRDNDFIKERQSLTSYLTQEDGIYDSRDLGIHHTGYYRPLMNFLYFLDYKLWGMNATGFRTTNLALHISCCLILYSLIILIIKDRNAAFWATILYAVHPVNTESVSFIMARNNIVVTIFILLSLYFYILSNERQHYLLQAVSIVFFSLALLTKEFGAMLLPILFFSNRFLLNKKAAFIKEILYYIPYVIALGLYFFLREGVIGNFVTPFAVEDLWSRIYFVPYLIAYNLKISFFPYGLHSFSLGYPAAFSFRYIIVSLLTILLILCFLWNNRRNGIILFSIFSFLLSLFPVLNIIPSSSISLISMRWLYLPMAFIMIGAAWFFMGLLKKRREIFMCLIIAGILYMASYSHILNISLWYNDERLFHQEAVNFNNYLYAGGFAENLLSNHRYEEAEEYFKIAIKKYPEEASAYLNYSCLLVEIGRYNEAIFYLNKAKNLTMFQWQRGQWNNNMGMALFFNGNRQNAIKYFERAVKMAPSKIEFLMNFGSVYGKMKEYPNAIHVFKSGLGIFPDSIQLRKKLALTYIKMAEYDQAIEALEEIPYEKRKTDNGVLSLLSRAHRLKCRARSQMDSPMGL